MPQHKVEAAVKEIANLKDEVKDEPVLTDASMIDMALEGDLDGSALNIARQMKAFQVSNNDKVIKGARTGRKLGEGIISHV